MTQATTRSTLPSKERRRQDEDLGFLIKYENVAWFESGVVRILDRRVYPTEISYVTCHDVREVAQAIADMVTQSAGPYTAAGMGMALAASQCALQPEALQISCLERAADMLSTARPTTECADAATQERSKRRRRHLLPVTTTFREYFSSWLSILLNAATRACPWSANS